MPILKRAIAEAEASGSAHTKRWATHDLGVALAMLDRHDEGLALLEHSHLPARSASDRALLMRGYINIPAVRQARGDPPAPLLPIVEEGLQLARRQAASTTIVWLAGNLADFMLDMGRVPEAEAYLDEAIRHGEVVSSPHLASKHCGRALARQLRGDLSGARRDLATAGRVGLSDEPQVAWSYPMSMAMLDWAAEPRGATERLGAWLTEHVVGPSAAIEAVIALGRMALRLDDRDRMEEAGRLLRLASTGAGSAHHEAKTRWADALVTSDHRSAETSARTFEDLGLHRIAADFWADAALIAARAGVDAEALGRARSPHEQMGMVPWLGPLPETRWLGPARDSAGAPSAA